ncbi:MAG: DUF3010 family protein [Flavobacteriales bacterium]|nr:DUF3010 family protein [Flavobacteriales bacterium]
MKICAVELKNNEANFCLLSNEGGLFEILPCRAQKFVFTQPEETQSILDFQKTFSKLMADYQIENVVIRARELKGKLAGSSISFKLETAIQLIDSLNVELYTTTEMKEKLKRNPLSIDFRSTELRNFQEEAFMTGYTYLSR